MRCFAGICRRSPLERRESQRARAWLGSDKDGWPFSTGRSSPGVRNSGLACHGEDEFARSSGGYFYHQRPRAPNPIAADIRTQEELLAECGRISRIPSRLTADGRMANEKWRMENEKTSGEIHGCENCQRDHKAYSAELWPRNRKFESNEYYRTEYEKLHPPA